MSPLKCTSFQFKKKILKIKKKKKNFDDSHFVVEVPYILVCKLTLYGSIIGWHLNTTDRGVFVCFEKYFKPQPFLACDSGVTYN